MLEFSEKPLFVVPVKSCSLLSAMNIKRKLPSNHLNPIEWQMEWDVFGCQFSKW